MNICIIPARGGSKRIPRKNIRDFCGKPMIAWSIEAARRSNCFAHVLVSTDDLEIAEIAKRWGAEVPFIRPPELSDDYIGTVAVVAHAVEWCRCNLGNPESVCCLYATAPFVEAEDLQNGLQALQETKAEYAFSVTSFPFPIQRAIRIDKQGRVEMFQPEHLTTRSQDLEEAWHDAGQFYWGTATAWLSNLPIYGGHSTTVLIPRSRVQDIDTLEDWHCAEKMFKS
jgi:pseudaminic acid cytidylyltransferase